MGVLYHHPDHIVWEAWDNFQKQTFRNRCPICTDQGLLNLNIPIRHLGGVSGRQRYRDVRTDESSNWRELHWKTLQNAYRSSPYFEYYEDGLREFFFPEEPGDGLYDLNLRSIEFLCNCLDIPFPDSFTGEYASESDHMDGRYLVVAKRRERVDLPAYTQVFGERHGFISNASTLDLIFNMGPEGSPYLGDLPSYSDFF